MEIKNKFDFSVVQQYTQPNTKETNKEKEIVSVTNGEMSVKICAKAERSVSINPTSISQSLQKNFQSFLSKIPDLLKSVLNRLDRAPIKQQVNINVVPHNASLTENPTMVAFKNDPGPKILLIAEAHSSGQTRAARKFVQTNSESIRGFSEGITGQPALCGLRGIEKPRDCEASVLLKDYNKYNTKDNVVEGYSKEETNQYLKKYAEFSDSDLSKLDRQFYNKPLEEREKFVTDMQIHKRDKNFANHISNECKEMIKNNEKLGACFFGASHVLPGNDGEDKRNTDARLPDVLLSAGGELKEHCIRLNGVNIYVLPKILEGNEADSELHKFLS